MHTRTALLLLLVVGGLAAGIWWQIGREQAATITGERALVPGVEKSRVVRLRVDNLERSVQLAMERDEDGTWQIVDPIAYPADQAIVTQLLDLVSTQSAYPVADPDLQALSLSPPRAVLELEQQTADGRTRDRLEFGATDLDGQHGFVRVNGVVVRTLRSLDSTLERDLADWRSRSLFTGISPYAVTEFHRRGRVALEREEPQDLTLDVVDDGGWRATAPWNARLDPGAIGMLISSAVFLRTTSFADDTPGDLADYGLDPAPLNLWFATADGRTPGMHLAPTTSGNDWYCVVDGDAHIYRISPEAGLLLITPLDALVARDVVRVVRDRVATVRFAAAGREVLLERTAHGWAVSGETAAGAVLHQVPADVDRVEDFLGELERERVLALLPDVEFPEGPRQGVWVEADGPPVGGSVGPAYTTSDGGVGALFRRAGDGLTTLVSEHLAELVQTDPDTLRSMSVADVDELDVARIELSAAAGSRTYVRNGKGRWSRQGTDVEALSFVPLVDRLLAQRAERYLQPEELPDANAPIEVRVLRRSGAELAYTLDVAADGRGVFRSAGTAAEVDPQLWQDLSALLQAQ